jgi:hypothetical protein
MRHLLVAALALLPATALAFPVQLAHQGRALDAAGGPIEGAHTVGVALYPGPTGGAAAWSGAIDAVLQGGHFAVLLGAGDAANPLLDHTVFNADLWVEVSVDGAVLGPREPLVHVPLAARAVVARAVDAGVDGGTTLGLDGVLRLGAPGPAPCDPGAIAFDRAQARLAVCNSGTWTLLGERTIVDTGTHRRWSDGTYAPSCDGYRHPEDPLSKYEGVVGSGVYRIQPGEGSAYDAYCEMEADGGGWTLAMRFSDSGDTFKFFSSHWTTASTLSPTSLDPAANADAKYPSFNEVVGGEIRGCLRHTGTGAVGCKVYALPAARTLLATFQAIPIGSRENGRGHYFTESRTARLEWLTLQGVSTTGMSSGTTINYVDTGLNVDDDLSCCHGRVRFGLAMNNETNIDTMNDAAGFGASSYGNCSCSVSESTWRVGCGTANGSTLIRTRGTIWVR